MFGFKKKKEQKKTETKASEYNYEQSKNYRGFKRVKLSSYGHKLSEAGIAVLTGSDLSDAAINIRVIADQYPRVEVRVNGNQVGTIWKRSNEEYYQWFKSGSVDKARVEISDGDSYLFIHKMDL